METENYDSASRSDVDMVKLPRPMMYGCAVGDMISNFIQRTFSQGLGFALECLHDEFLDNRFVGPIKGDELVYEYDKGFFARTSTTYLTSGVLEPCKNHVVELKEGIMECDNSPFGGGKLEILVGYDTRDYRRKKSCGHILAPDLDTLYEAAATYILSTFHRGLFMFIDNRSAWTSNCHGNGGSSENLRIMLQRILDDIQEHEHDCGKGTIFQQMGTCKVFDKDDEMDDYCL